MSVTLRELQVYRLRVGLFAHKWSAPTSLGDHGLIHAGSHCYLDQIVDGWACFHLFGEDCKGLYVKMPVEYADDQLEEVLGSDGQPVVLQEDAAT